MKKFIVVLLLVIASNIFAQETLFVASKEPLTKDFSLSQNMIADETQQKGNCTIIGTVIDQSSREPIAKSKIAILGTKFTSWSSEDGQYKIESVAEGMYQIKAEAEGYEPQILNNVSFSKDRNANGFFTLQKIQQGPPPDFVEVEKQPQPISGDNSAPTYPDEAIQKKIEGTVWIKIWIDKEGKPKQAVVLKSDAEIFNQPSIDAAMKWRFTPAILKGKPVDVWVSIPFKFKLSHDVEPKDSITVDQQAQPKKGNTPAPFYPQEAKQKKIEGTVWIKLWVDEQGNAKKAIVVKSESELLNQASVDAAMKWKFTPALIKEKPVAVWVTVPFKFKLDSGYKEEKK